MLHLIMLFIIHDGSSSQLLRSIKWLMIFFGNFQVEQAQDGMDALASSQKTINHLRDNFLSIEKYAVLKI